MDRAKVKTLIQQKNDNFRMNLLEHASKEQRHFMPSPAIQHLYKTSPKDFYKVLEEAMFYKGFTADNDPWGEHDMALFSYNGTRYFWKIEYYDKNFEGGVEDKHKLNDEICKRALILAEASEY